MTVKELIEELQTMDGSKLVVLQKDSEGNGYSPVAGVDDEAVYLAETSYSGEVYNTSLSFDGAGYGTEEEWEQLKKGNTDCVVFFPIN